MTTERSPKANEIISYTRQLLTSGGYQSFSFADISAKVNIRKASIHHHFPSKAELVKVVVTEYREEARAGMQAMTRQMNDPLAELQAYVDYWATCIREGSSPFCICAMLAVELPTLPAEVAREVSGHFADLSEWLATLLRRGESEKRLRLPVSPADEASLLMATVHGAMLSARAFNDADIFRRIVQPLIDNLHA
ncbi:MULTISPECIES: TetR/AcrR family transcriptional regulator [Raoultella]|jgi:TetR/AcrR family transcriptional repressor of nem operon|uniref:TetR/AcrR family transcriptional regulator n=1 Tax=Raoultella TaxID=160674 RepID=UPI0009782C06|nr:MULTISPECIES: TetR/AcrR family transcriptional regulator [Raoultella]MCS4270075.1 TetR/AcrR family transcriptional repressor of nem operon [Raoultella sp. BIGb0132]MCS4287035.1 TetR/AcrR family transcriptional repressor of nem operon [Raoultella terrigena]OMP97027.1 TetR family transcriptional regulator [Raoultella terrigena]